MTAAQLGALCAWTAFHAGDRVGGLVLGSEAIATLRPLRSRARVQALCAEVVKANQGLSAQGEDRESDKQPTT